MRFFFYGSLMDADVRRLVLGRLVPATAEPATLKGWRRVRLAGVTYPGLVRDGRGCVAGTLVRGLGREARERLIRYEGDGYDLIPVTIVTGSGRECEGLTFVSGEALKRAPGVWDFAVWQRQHKRRFLASVARSGDPR